jgi:hypothetical protein
MDKKNHIIYAGIWRGYKVLSFISVIFIGCSLFILWMNDFYSTGINNSLYSALLFGIPGLTMLISFKGIEIDFDNVVITKNLLTLKKKHLPIKNVKYVFLGGKSLYHAKPAVLANEPTEVLAVFLVDFNGDKFDISEYFPMTRSPKTYFLLAKKISDSIKKPIVIEREFRKGIK